MMLKTAGWVAVYCLVVGAFGGVALGEEKGLKVGDPLPKFEADGCDGKKVALDGFKKEKKGVIIFFFPKAFTMG